MPYSDRTNGHPELAEDDPRLDVDLLDELMLGRGAKTKAEHARRFGIDYTHYFTLRSGESLPSLKTAVRMTREAGTTVEALFGLERAA